MNFISRLINAVSTRPTTRDAEEIFEEEVDKLSESISNWVYITTSDTFPEKLLAWWEESYPAKDIHSKGKLLHAASVRLGGNYQTWIESGIEKLLGRYRELSNSTLLEILYYIHDHPNPLTYYVPLTFIFNHQRSLPQAARFNIETVLVFTKALMENQLDSRFKTHWKMLQEGVEIPGLSSQVDASIGLLRLEGVKRCQTKCSKT